MPSGTTAGDVLGELAKLDERFTPALPSARLAINGEWANSDRVVMDGDDVALIPPVSGG
jgi:molybdopterin converting factor small subunit